MTTPTEHEGPQGDLLLRTMPMPADTSFNGDVFGGWIMSQMDLAGSMMAKEVTRTRTATVAVESMKFISQALNTMPKPGDGAADVNVAGEDFLAGMRKMMQQYGAELGASL